MLIYIKKNLSFLRSNKRIEITRKMLSYSQIDVKFSGEIFVRFT